MGTQIPIKRFGLTEVSSSKPASVDVVFVHGLNGDPQKTWTAETSRTFWPSQLLPPILEEEHARILVYGYDADVSSFTDGASKDKIHNHAEHLVAELAANRRIRRASDRPIIFIAHSLGGLVVKRALIYSSEIRGTKTEHLRGIFVSTYAILFLGTPHKGSDLAKWGSRLERICSAVMPKKIVDTNTSLVSALKENNETLQNIDRQFIQIMSKFHIYFFHEAKPTDLKGTLEYVVDEESASPTVQDVERAGIQADHSHMCKFESENAPGFDLVAEAIQRYAEEAPTWIKGRWAAEAKERVIQKEAAAEELLPGSVKGNTPHSDAASTFESSPGSSTILNPPQPSPQPELIDDATTTTDLPAKPTEPFFIVPPGFRANTFFVGMEKEYQELDRHLFDKRRQDGTACVLLHGQAGGGKSHLARQYVDKNRKKFAGGIFWIMAKSREERDHAFSNIYQKVVTRDNPDMCDVKRTFVDTVKAWFESRQEWLMVFDGVTLDRDEDATELQRFIPDSQNSSLIYISRAKNLESKQRLLRPFAIRVASLKEDDARKLLFKELHIEQPKDADVKKATELVKKVGGLPLAIDAIAHRISDTHEPLAKFKIEYFADPKMGGTYNKILDDLQNSREMGAWNLIHVLCFFGSHIPVELVHLGLKSLTHDSIEVKSNDEGGKPDINTTFSILMRNALIERNEPDDSSMSSSRDSLVGPEPIDVLKIHSVVQKFCLDSLNGMNIFPIWIGYAMRLFAHSFHKADVRIKRMSDYREYLTHGQRLWDNSLAYKSVAQPLDDVRRYLKPIMDKIVEEIQNREPRSSQESLTKGMYQISIFDRTSSSSESNPSPSEARTPEHRPSPLPLPNENLYGLPLEKPAIDSPRSVGTSTPPTSGHPRIVGGSPRFPPYINEDGYESDRDESNVPNPMRRNLSDTTARPPDSIRRPPDVEPRPRAPTAESNHSGWQTVPLRKPKSTRRRRDLGTFRPTPIGAQINRQHAAGSVGRFEAENNQRAITDAFSSLAEVQQKSPPATKESGISSFFHRRSTSKPEPADTRPSWAKVVSGPARPLPRNQLPTPVQDSLSPSAMSLERGRSRESVRGRQGNVQHSPLTSEFNPSRNNSYSGSYRPATPQDLKYSDSSSTFTPPSAYQPPEPNPIDPYPNYNPVQPLGPHPTHRPFYENIAPPTRRPHPTPPPREASPLTQPPTSAYHSPPSHHSQSPHSPYSPYGGRSSPSSPYSPPRLPTGYTSAPMSRDHSHFSYGSAATEPPRYMPPSSISPHPPYNPLYASSTRDRAPDGRALRKSPKMAEYAMPVPPHEDPTYSPPYHYTHHPSPPSQYDHPLSQNTHYPTSHHSSPGPGAAASMSRSSSGPGLALESPSGLGIVRFGEHEAISLEEARRRTFEHEARLRLGGPRRRGGEGEGLGTPYPEDGRGLEELVGGVRD